MNYRDVISSSSGNLYPQSHDNRIALKFDRHPDSAAAEVLAKFHRDYQSKNSFPQCCGGKTQLAMSEIKDTQSNWQERIIYQHFQIYHNSQSIHHYVVMVWKLCMYSVIRYWHQAKFPTGRMPDNNLSTTTKWQNNFTHGALSCYRVHWRKFASVV